MTTAATAPHISPLPEDHPMKTIDLTPTWVSLVPVLMHIAKYSESPSGLRDATDELTKMAKAADLWNAHCKEQIATLEQVAVANGTANE